MCLCDFNIIFVIIFISQGSGKTELADSIERDGFLKSLFDDREKAPRNEGNDRVTRGVAVRTIRIPTGKFNNNVQYSLWEFSGQLEVEAFFFCQRK